MHRSLPLGAAVFLTFALPAQAQTTAQTTPKPPQNPVQPANGHAGHAHGPGGSHPAFDEEPELPLVPPARDTLGGHFVVGASFGALWPLGSLDTTTAQSDVVGTGFGANVDLGYGVSRYVAIGLWGQYSSHGSTSNCAECSATSGAVGPFVRYHLVQGTRFDPWVSAGLGLRTLNLEAPPALATEGTYSGLEFLRLQFGGDWYAHRLLGLGPVAELDVGTFQSRPTGSVEGSVGYRLVLSLRLTLDVPGK